MEQWEVVMSRLWAVVIVLSLAPILGACGTLHANDRQQFQTNFENIRPFALQ